MNMALTREFKETVKARAARDPTFREGFADRGSRAAARRRPRNGQGRATRLHQRHGRFREIGQGDRDACQEPDADARVEGQPTRQ
jgi:hypothetical protein